MVGIMYSSKRRKTGGPSPCRDVRAVGGGVLRNLLLHVDEGLGTLACLLCEAVDIARGRRREGKDKDADGVSDCERRERGRKRVTDTAN